MSLHRTLTARCNGRWENRAGRAPCLRVQVLDPDSVQPGPYNVLISLGWTLNHNGPEITTFCPDHKDQAHE